MLQRGHLKDVPSDDGFLIVDIVEARLAQGISIMRSWDPRGDAAELLKVKSMQKYSSSSSVGIHQDGESFSRLLQMSNDQLEEN